MAARYIPEKIRRFFLHSMSSLPAEHLFEEKKCKIRDYRTIPLRVSESRTNHLGQRIDKDDLLHILKCNLAQTAWDLGCELVSGISNLEYVDGHAFISGDGWIRNPRYQ